MTERPVLTLDIDGVIAGGEYIPEWDRKPRVYEELPLLEQIVPECVAALTKKWNVYLLSGRRYDGALMSTRRWVEWNLDGPALAGIIVWAYPPEVKARVAMEVLHSWVHVDDCPAVIEAIEAAEGSGVLKINPNLADQWPGIRRFVEDRGGQGCVATWAELMRELDQRYESWLAWEARPRQTVLTEDR